MDINNKAPERITTTSESSFDHEKSTSKDKKQQPNQREKKSRDSANATLTKNQNIWQLRLSYFAQQ